jgi:hypothetical protein
VRVRKLGLGALAWREGSLNGGEVGDVPIDVLERYAHKLEVLDPMPAAEPISEPEPVKAWKPRARKRKPS